MKGRFIVFIVLLYCISFGHSEANLFSLVGLDCFINIKKMETMTDFCYFLHFENDSILKVCRVNSYIQRSDNIENHIVYYNPKGLPSREESKVHEDHANNYEYDEKDRLLSYREFTFKYIDDFQRERYCRGKLQYKEILNFQQNKIFITVVSYVKRTIDNAMVESGKRVYEYVFNDELLTDIFCTNINLKGIEKKNKNHLVFSYENGKLIRTREFYGDELREEQVFKYRDEMLVERSVSFPTKNAVDYSSEYSDFDKYGNFRKYVEKTASGDVVSLSRMIEYR